MYYCNECEREFETPRKEYESHGLPYPPFEKIYVCPFCRSNSISKKTTHCRCCGAKLKNGKTEYCSSACRFKGEKLWQKQNLKIKEMYDNPLNQKVREVEIFNRKNNTNYSYGQFVALEFLKGKKRKCTKKKSNI